MKDKRARMIWSRSRHLLLRIYRITELFPNGDPRSLKCEIRRTCVAIPANISRGFRGYKKDDLKRFFMRSIKSANKLERQLQNARDMHFLNNIEYKKLRGETENLISMMGSLLGT